MEVVPRIYSKKRVRPIAVVDQEFKNMSHDNVFPKDMEVLLTLWLLLLTLLLRLLLSLRLLLLLLAVSTVCGGGRGVL